MDVGEKTVKDTIAKSRDAASAFFPARRSGRR